MNNNFGGLIENKTLPRVGAILFTHEIETKVKKYSQFGLVLSFNQICSGNLNQSRFLQFQFGSASS